MSNPTFLSKVKDLDNLLNEYEFNFASFKLKQQSLEKRIEVLEKEFGKLRQKPLRNKTNSSSSNAGQPVAVLNTKKLVAIEESHRILEKELKLLRDLQNTDLESIKENIDTLQSQILGEAAMIASSSQSMTGISEATSSTGIVDLLQQQCAEIQDRLNTLRKRKKENSDMQRNYGELKSEMRSQFNSLVEERRQFEMEKNMLTRDLEKLNENPIVVATVTTDINSQTLDESMLVESNSATAIMLQQESILELEQKADEWEQKYKSELDSFNLLSQQQETQIKQLREQLLTAKLNNEAKNLDLTNQLKLLNSDDIDSNISIIESKSKEKLNETIKENSNNEDRMLIMSKYPSVNDFLENESKINALTKSTSQHMQETAAAMPLSLKSKNVSLNESIMDLESKLSEWGLKYYHEIDSFNRQQTEQILLNKKEETQIKLLKDQITAAKLVNDSEQIIMDSYHHDDTTSTTNMIKDSQNPLLNNPKRLNIKESILNLEAKFSELEKIYNSESALLDNQLKSINSTNLITSSYNLKQVHIPEFVKESLSRFSMHSLDETKNLIKSEHDLNRLIKSNSAETIFVLEAKVEEWEKKHQRELEIFNVLSRQQEIQIKELKEKLSIEALQVESLNADYSTLQVEAARLENLLKSKCENLENELNETNRLNEYECELVMKNKKYTQTYENYDKEIKSLVEQISHLVISKLI